MLLTGLWVVWKTILLWESKFASSSEHSVILGFYKVLSILRFGLSTKWTWGPSVSDRNWNCFPSLDFPSSSLNHRELLLFPCQGPGQRQFLQYWLAPSWALISVHSRHQPLTDFFGFSLKECVWKVFLSHPGIERQWKIAYRGHTSKVLFPSLLKNGTWLPWWVYEEYLNRVEMRCFPG